MEKSRKTTTKSDPSTGDQLSKRRAETWPGRVRRSLVAFLSPAAGRMPKPGPVVCAEAWSRSEARPPAACRSPARSCAPKPCRRSRSEARPGAGNCPARPGPARPARPARPGPAARRGAVWSGRAQRGQAGHGPAGGGKETGKTDSTTVEITCACRRMTDRARRFANFWKQIEKND